jgi:hypothetical protein
MTPQVGPRTRARMLCLTVICLSLLVRPAAATVISYTFDPGSELIETDSAVLPVSGNFTFDTTDGSVTGGAITVSGPTPFPLTSTSINPVTIGGVVAGIQAFVNNDFAESFLLSFTPALGVPGTLQVALLGSSAGFPADLASFSGSVTGTVPVPEAPTWAMMLAGFAGLGYVGYRRTRRAPVTIA